MPDYFTGWRKPDPAHIARVESVWEAFDPAALKRVCEAHESTFGETYGMERVNVRSPGSRGEYLYFKDNGSQILAVAHLDTVMDHDERTANFVNTAAGPVVFSGALDDRLGAYTILELLPKLGLTFDVLLTTGEEDGLSTAEYFDPVKDYQWMIEFDRAGTDVVMYEYEDEETVALVEEAGARVGVGSFSDIAYLEHLEVKGFNWGIGYGGDYHGPRAHAFLTDTVTMVARFLLFHEQNRNEYLPHEMKRFGGRLGLSPWFEEEEIDLRAHMSDDPWWDDPDPADVDEDDPVDPADAVIDNPTAEDHAALMRTLGLSVD